MATAYGCAGTSSGKAQERGLARTHEVARHGEDEVGVGAVHLVEEGVDHRRTALRSAYARTSASRASTWSLRRATGAQRILL